MEFRIDSFIPNSFHVWVTNKFGTGHNPHPGWWWTGHLTGQQEVVVMTCRYSDGLLYWLAEQTYLVWCIRPKEGSAMKTCSDSKHTVVVFWGFFKHIFSNLKEKKLVQKSGLMQKCDSMLCSCLFSSSNKNKILRVTFFLKKTNKRAVWLPGCADARLCLSEQLCASCSCWWMVAEKVSRRNSCFNINCFSL